MEREWYSTELNEAATEMFRKYLVEHDIPYEVSEVYHMVHFECCMTENEKRAANEWIMANVEDA